MQTVPLPTYPNPQIVRKLAKLLPILSIFLAIPTLTVVAQAQAHHHQHGQIANIGRGHMENLNLTPAQQTKLEQLRQSTQTQIDRVLTPEQRQKFQQLETQHRARHQAGEELNLTADQKLKLKALRQSQQQQFQAILTPAQQAQLRQERDGDRGEFGERGGHMARLDKLNLTPDQKAKLEQLKATGRTQMAAILTPAQRQQMPMQQPRRAEMENAWNSMNLTADQKAKIKAIHQASEREFQAILTPEQQSQLKSHKHGRKHHSL